MVAKDTDINNQGNAKTGLSSDPFPFDTENPSGVPGVTQIEASVIAAISGHVARSVEGVARLGTTGGIVRAVADTVRSRAASLAAGVDVEAGKKEAILDVALIVNYGYRVPELVRKVREEVAKELNNLVGLVAKEINVSVVGIEFPDNERVRVE